MFDAWAWGTYIFFAVFLAGGIVWVWFCLSETKNASLEEMDRVFGSRVGEADQRKLTEIRHELGLEPILSQSYIARDKGSDDASATQVEKS